MGKLEFRQSNFTIFFSLPFYPVIKTNFFYNGHLALGLGNYVYQVYNPNLLKSDFFMSKMPINDWLYNDSNRWVDKKKYENYFNELEKKYQNGKIKFNLFSYNCASIINEILYKEKWLKKSFLIFYLQYPFRRILKSWKNNKFNITYGKIKSNNTRLFKVHNFCFGIPSFPAENYMDKIIG